jgi:hypothetical protein
MSEFIPDDDQPARAMTYADRDQADRDNLAKAQEWGRGRRAGEIRDPGCDSVSRWLPQWLAENNRSRGNPS